jgi:ubiquinone/menaquinone biosynthesis C-methylase UbiE
VRVRGTVLDLGCGPADVTARFAEEIDDVAVHGVDGSEEMLRFGRARLDEKGLSERVSLHLARLPEQGPPLPKYDAIISNSLLHHLHDPQALWTSIVRYAAPGAPIFVMDLMRPESLDHVERILARYAAGAPEVLRKDFHASLCAAFTPDEVRLQLREAGLSHLAIDLVSDRHFIVTGRAHSPAG